LHAPPEWWNIRRRTIGRKRNRRIVRHGQERVLRTERGRALTYRFSAEGEDGAVRSALAP
jgi:hypothetical protein